MGFLVREHALTVDNVLAAEVVTAGGELLNADKHAPLISSGLQGGGSDNFGVVCFTPRGSDRDKSLSKHALAKEYRC